MPLHDGKPYYKRNPLPELSYTFHPEELKSLIPRNSWKGLTKRPTFDVSKMPPPRKGVTAEKFKNGCYPVPFLQSLSIEDLLTLWIYRRSILATPGHKYFEALLHLIFPRSNEVVLVYVALWVLRDRCGPQEIQRRLSLNWIGVWKQSPNLRTIRGWMEYITFQIEKFAERTKLKDKIVADFTTIDDPQEPQSEGGDPVDDASESAETYRG
jgi:hypothetical protein